MRSIFLPAPTKQFMRDEMASSFINWIGFLFCIAALFSPSSAWSRNRELLGSFEFGKRSAAEDFEEENDDAEYRYYNSRLKFRHHPKPNIRYDLGTSHTKKNYRAANALDNDSRIFNGGFSLQPADSGKYFSGLSLKAKYKEKRFDISPKNEFNQTRVTAKMIFMEEDRASFDLSGGINRYSYLSAEIRSENKIFGRIAVKKIFHQKKLRLSSAYRLDRTDQRKKDRKRVKHDVTGHFNYKFDVPWIRRLKTGVRWSHRDTKDEDIRDEDLDYQYWRVNGRTDHKINTRWTAHLKYIAFRKNYLTGDLDNRGNVFENGWRADVLKNARGHLWAVFDISYKSLNYPVRTNNDSIKRSAGVTLNYRRKEAWKISWHLEGSVYRFNKTSNDKERYLSQLSGETPLMNKNLILSTNIKYKHTARDTGTDTDQSSLGISANYTF